MLQNSLDMGGRGKRYNWEGNIQVSQIFMVFKMFAHKAEWTMKMLFFLLLGEKNDTKFWAGMEYKDKEQWQIFFFFF